MANLTSVDDREFIDVDLMAENCVIERVFILLDQIVYALLRQQANVVLQIFFALLSEFRRLFQQLRLLAQHLSFFLAQSVEGLFKLRKVHLLPRRLSSSVCRHVDRNDFLLFFVELSAVMLTPELARRGFQLVGNNNYATTLVKKWLGNGIELCLNLRHPPISLRDVSFDFV